jgi:dGTPase
MKEMYSEGDKRRAKSIPTDPNFAIEDYRTPWRRDYARLLHSPSFRRLQGKAQLFPGMETDFFRNRLTHSLEVAQIAKSIAIKLNHDLKRAGHPYQIEPDIVEFAALAHDLGHPPFGHFGEEALDELMLNCGGFEGNAQTLRILTKLEKRELTNAGFGIDQTGKDIRVGLDLTCRSLASVLKYDNKIPFRKSQRKDNGVIKGYYSSEYSVVKKIKNHVSPKRGNKKFKTVECQIMDIADDIAYSTYDLEDSFKAGFLKPLDLICAPGELLEMISKKLKDPRRVGVNISVTEIKERIRNIFADFKIKYELGKDEMKVTQELLEGLHFFTLDYAEFLSNSIARDGYFRTRFTSRLVGSAIRKVMIKKVDKKIPSLSTIELEKDKLIDVEILKNYVFQSQILSPKIQIFKKRSREIIFEIFKALNDSDGEMLLPEDFNAIHKSLKSKNDKKRTICDFIAGMTDSYAIEFYGRLKAINPQTIFKPMS